MVTTLTQRQIEIMLYIRDYAGPKNGPTPTINEIAKAVGVAYSTAYYHVRSLRLMNKLTVEEGKLCVVGSEWLPPPDLMSLD